MNTSVSFELADALKKKGFNEETFRFYTKHGRNYYPTIVEVVMWLYEKHGIWIYTRPMIENKNVVWRWVVLNTHLKATKDTLWEKWDEPNFSNSPKEATEAALLFTLKNLIP